LADELQSGIDKIFELIPEEKTPAPRQDTIRLSSLSPRTKLTLKDKNDVDEYIDTLKKKLLHEIDNNKHILL